MIFDERRLRLVLKILDEHDQLYSLSEEAHDLHCEVVDALDEIDKRNELCQAISKVVEHEMRSGGLIGQYIHGAR